MGKKLIRIYTPFLMAFVSFVHSVLYLSGYEGLAYNIFSATCGYSILAIAYIIATSRRMCKFYKATNWLLFSVNVLNLLYFVLPIGFVTLIYSTLSMSIAAMITFLIHRFRAGMKRLNGL